MRTPIILQALRHDIWATEKYIAHCRTLTKQQLDMGAPGTYGSIRATLCHLVRGDERYLARLVVYPGFDTHLPESNDASLDEIAKHLAAVKDTVEKLFSGSQFDPEKVVVDANRRVPTDPPLEIESWTMLVQFTHHGSDHRAHLGTVLGANGLEAPTFDVWAYGRETGAIRERKR